MKLAIIKPIFRSIKMLKKPNLVDLCQLGIEVILMVIFFLVPLLVVPSTSELFEFNKMYLVFAGSAILLILEAIKLLTQKKPALTIPPLSKAWLIFLAALTLATIFSIDPHVSFFGFYDRWNGGLWSWLSYGVIFYSICQLPLKEFLTLLKISLVSGTLVGAWGIAEHFGVDASYWVQDVRARVFSTLGQPNWLAAYFVMLIPLALTFFINTKRKLTAAVLYSMIVIYYTCFIFTYSRGGDFGLAAGMAIWLILIGRPYLRSNWKKLSLLAVGMLVITAILATPLTGLFFKNPPQRSEQVFVEGDTGNIRIIVWEGAWGIFTHHPILGTGLETFGESFYQYRPDSLNYTTEWDFLFNKAHNEYFNYLATTGVVGTAAYLFLLLSFYWQALKLIRSDSKNKLLYAAGVASTSGYLVQNVFSFSVVPLAVLFVLNLSFLSLGTKNSLIFTWPKLWSRLQHLKIQTLLLLPLAVALLIIFNLWSADIFYGSGAGENSVGASFEASRDLSRAVLLNPTEPIYIMELALAQATQAAYSEAPDPALISEADRNANLATQISPNLLSLWRTKGQVYENLGLVDKKYLLKAEESKIKATLLAPNEPKVRLELAAYYLSQKRSDVALTNYFSALKLKDDYTDALIAVSRIYLDQKNPDQAKIYIKRALKADPTNGDAATLSKEVGL